MGLEYISQPQIFLSPISALGGIQTSTFVGTPEYYTSFYTWTSTSSVTATTFPLTGTETLTNLPGSFIVTVGGVLQSPTNYTIDIISRSIIFDYTVNPDTPVVITQIGTTGSILSVANLTASESVFNNITVINSTFNNISAGNLLVTNLTSENTVLRNVNITEYELSGFNISGNVNIEGNLGVVGLTGTNIVILDTGSLIGATSATSIGIGSLSARSFDLIHDPANDNVDPIFNIGETLTGSFSGFRIRYEEPTNRLVGSSRTGTTILTSFMITTNTGQVGISGLPAPGQALTVSGSLSTSGLRSGPGTTTVAPIVLTSGTNLATPVAGAIEYDGTTLYTTPNTNFGRAAIPASIFTSGAGTTLTQNQETTNTTLFPAANDTITLPVGTYYVIWNISVPRGTSTTSAQLRVRFGGGATAAFSGNAIGSNVDAGATNAYRFNAVSNGTDMIVTPSSITSGGVYVATITGILRVTSSGTIVPGYSFNALLNVVGAALPASNSLLIQSLNTSDTATFIGGWA